MTQNSSKIHSHVRDKKVLWKDFLMQFKNQQFQQGEMNMKSQQTMRVISLLVIQPSAKQSNQTAIQRNVRILTKYPKNHNHNS